MLLYSLKLSNEKDSSVVFIPLISLIILLTSSISINPFWSNLTLPSPSKITVCGIKPFQYDFSSLSFEADPCISSVVIAIISILLRQIISKPAIKGANALLSELSSR